MRICLLAEGSYPYVVGGVSSWIQMLMEGLPEHEFVVYTIGAEMKDRGKFKFKLPANCVGIEEVFLDEILSLRASDMLEGILTHDDCQALYELVRGERDIPLKRLLETLEKSGITEINPVGEKLDPERHQALSAIPSPDAEPNTILHVAQKGYLLNGRVIRAAQVIVADGAQKNPPQS